MKRLAGLLIKGIGIALAGFSLLGMIWDIKNGGNYVMNNGTYSKMVIEAILVGIGFSVPALIYYNPNIPYCLKILFHMGIGNAVFLIISFSVGWISLSWGVKGCILAVCIEVLITFGLWLIFALYYKNLAKKMNEKLQAKNSNYSD